MSWKKNLISLLATFSVIGCLIFILQINKLPAGSVSTSENPVLQPLVKKISMENKQETTKSDKHYNRLINEKSPYLLKHAENPVDWYPWGDEAFKKAREEDKPVFLSIGYSTCHWCNVMERESYDDPEVGKLMNDAFISVKVDREERPDIDNIYIAVCQMMSRNGCGWPLNIIMTSNKNPFFAATYIPKNSRFGRLGLMELIPRVKDAWKNRREEIVSTANRVTEALKSSSPGTPGEEPMEGVLKTAFEQLNGGFDDEHGGFGQAPKFPSPHTLSFLLRYWSRTGDSKSLLMVEKTLHEMSSGGMYDHVGFGFHRYSTDQEWHVPHFEKMLYDQALLAMAYTEAFQITDKEEYAKVAKSIFTYVQRDMTSPEGVFYSAEDADSEGEEGKFYFWTTDEIEKVLDKDEAELIIKVFNIEKEGNYIDQLKGEKTGENIFYLQDSLEKISKEEGVSLKKIELRLEKARQKLFTIRKKRVHPYKDDKTLTDWNGLMIAALAKGGQAFDEPAYTKAAKQAADFILKNMRTSAGRLLHRYRAGDAAIPAMVGDYAYFTWGLLELYEATFEVKYIDAAIELTEDLLKHFWDKKNGGFFFSADDGEKMLVPWKDFSDGAMPSGNSVSMLNLLRLGRITGNATFEEKASEIGRLLSNDLKRFPTAYTQILLALDFGLGPSYEVVISGKTDAKDTKEMLKAIRSRFIPNKVVILRPAEQEPPDIVRIAKFAENQISIDGKSTAYVCLNYNCKLPTTDINEMLGFLKVSKES
ncbi:MAG TPA: thioredoxin domain-containing protein [Nitrospinota bacterium]|nr:thioredoxin domain-containing protein [Nitrospinota bacterium]